MLKVKIGGVAGLGSSEATALISLDKLTFAPGETVQVHVEMDNTQCRKPVKSYKVKLHRKIQCFAGKANVSSPLFVSEEYVETKKYPGCDKKIKDVNTIEF